jgi:hypothetical protein
VRKVGQYDFKIKDALDEWIYALKESEVKPEFKAKGIQKGEAALLVGLLKRRFANTITREYLERLEKAASETLSRWSENFSDVKNIEAICAN